MMINIEKNVGRPTSNAASSIVCLIDKASFAVRVESRRNTFSTTMTAPSTIIPKSIAPNESKFAGMPRIVSPMNVASSANGITSATINAGRMCPRNTKSTNRTSAAPSSRFVKTVFSVVSIRLVRS